MLSSASQLSVRNTATQRLAAQLVAQLPAQLPAQLAAQPTAPLSALLAAPTLPDQNDNYSKQLLDVYGRYNSRSNQVNKRQESMTICRLPKIH